MSGPKTSRYTLTSEQRRLLEIQRETERRKVVAKEKLVRIYETLVSFEGKFTSEKQVADELQRRTGNDGGFTVQYSELQRVLASGKECATVINTDNVDSLEMASDSMGKRLKEAELLSKKLSDISAVNDVALKSNLSEEIDRGFLISLSDLNTPSHKDEECSEDIDKTKYRILFRIAQMKHSEALPIECKAELENAEKEIERITDITFLKNYSAVTVTAILKKSSQIILDYEKYHDEFDRLNSEYRALCKLYYLVPQEYVCSADSIKSLKSEIVRINESAAYDDEQGYISECLDEVMAEMGYSVIGYRDVAKKNGKHFHCALYTYSDGTAVNITFATDGKIAMELGGIDTSDRLPSEYEKSELCKTMHTFCDSFEEIEKRLTAKGIIVLDRISLLPPTEDYAQIINNTDYVINGEVETIHRKKCRKKVEKARAIRKE